MNNEDSCRLTCICVYLVASPVLVVWTLDDYGELTCLVFDNAKLTFLRALFTVGEASVLQIVYEKVTDQPHRRRLLDSFKILAAFERNG